MSLVTALLVLVTAAFAIFTGYALSGYGYIGIFTSSFANPATLQVLLDLVILGTLACVWMVLDARKTGRNPWPYVLATLTLGSFGPLSYLLIGRLGGARNPVLAG